MPVDFADVQVELRPAAEAALRAAGVVEGHLSVELVAPGRIRELNREHRGRDEPTDVLSFPIDGTGRVDGPRELGDVVICPEHASDLDGDVTHGASLGRGGEAGGPAAGSGRGPARPGR